MQLVGSVQSKKSSVDTSLKHCIPKKMLRGSSVSFDIKELEATINTAQMEITKKENSCKILETETQKIQGHLQTLSGNKELFHILTVTSGFN